MHESILRRLEAENLSVGAGLIPGAQPPPPRRGLILGYDCEWDASSGALVSVQFAAMVDGRPIARVYDAPSDKLTVAQLVQLVTRFVAELGLEVPPSGVVNVYLVAHYAGAELGQFDDVLRDSDVVVIHKAHFARLPETEIASRRWKVQVIDLYAIYKTSLRSVGLAVGLPKLELSNDEIKNMAALRRREPERFTAYAARDAEIAVLAFERLRADMLARWGVDPLIYRTVASLALAVFRFGFLGQRAAVPWHVERMGRKRARVVNNRALRTLALRAYWGGRNEAYVRGLYRGAVVDLDVRSMYPFAAILQPLPTEETEWRTSDGSTSGLTDDEVQTVEGFVHVEFEFPRECHYPCLPAAKPGIEKLYFPRRGESFCTMAEVRAALALGARITFVEWWVFEPGDVEREHDVSAYMKHFIAAKSAASADSLEYVTTKLLLNSLVGKLAERVSADLTTSIERFGRLQGVRGLAELLSKSPATRGMLRARTRTGGGFAPEWPALILGRARAIMASIIASARALLVSTDGIVAPGDARLDDCDGVRALRSVGSDLEEKKRGDGLWVGRERLYAVLRRSHARGWEIAKIARHGMPGNETEAGEDVLACLTAGADVAKVRRRVRLVSAIEAARRKLRVNDEVIEERKATFKWDMKRRLLDRDVNIFTSLSRTAPYATIGSADKAEQLRLCTRAVLSVKRRRHAREVVEKATELIQSGDLSNREIATRTGTSKSWVHDLRKKLVRQEPLVRPRRRPIATGEVPPAKAAE